MTTAERGAGVARQYAILQTLAAHQSTDGGRPGVVSTGTLRALSADYRLRDDMTPAQRAAARQLFIRDLGILVGRGLVDTGLTTTATPNATGVRLRHPAKPAALHLTAQEHAALQRARDRCRPGPARPAGGSAHDIELADEVLRHLQERAPGREVDGATLAGQLGVSETRLQRVLRMVFAPPGLLLDVVPDLLDELGRDLALDWDDELPSGRWGPGWTVSLTSTASVAGLGRVGRFAYTAAEVQERLSLIEAAQHDPGLDPTDRRLLEEVETKLLQWRAELRRPVSGTGRRRGPDGTRRGRNSPPQPTR